MSGSNFDALFDTFTASAHRLEALPSYAVSREDSAMRAFLDGSARPERSVRTSPWVRRMALSTAAGKRWSRTRVVDAPMTDYERFELPSYLESQTAGEEIRVISRDDAHALLERDSIGDDFWLFDAATDAPFAAAMLYGPDGTFDGFNLVRDLDVIGEMRRVAELLHTSATTLPEFFVREGLPL